MKAHTLAATTVATVAGLAVTASAGTIDFDLTGIESYGGLGDLLNTTVALEIPVGEAILTIEWENVVGDGGGGPSWGNEMAFMIFEGANQIGYVNFFPSEGSATAGGVWGPASGGINLAANEIVNTGNGLSLEFFELYDDGPGANSTYSSGTVTVTYGAIPAPGALALLGLAGLAGGRRRRG